MPVQSAQPEARSTPAPDPNRWRTEVPAPGKRSTLIYPPTKVHTLKNGMPLYALRWDSPTQSVRIACKHQPDPPKQAGLTALTTRMLTEGTQQKTSLELAIAAESLGTTLNYNTDADVVHFDLMLLPEQFAAGVALLAEVVRSPGFRNADFLRIKKERIDDITMHRQNPQRLSWMFGLRGLLGPELGRSTLGTPKQVEALTLGDVRKQYLRTIAPENCGLLTAGPLSAEELVSAAESAFARWRTSALKAPATEPATRADTKAVGSPQPPKTQDTDTSPRTGKPAVNRLLVFDRPGDVQTSLWIGHAFPRYAEPGHEARQVLNNLFGGLFTSRLNLNLREEHAYTYGAASMALATTRSGAFIVSSSVRTETTEAALGEVFSELSRLRQRGNLQEEEVMRAKTDLVFSVAARLEHTHSLLEGLGLQFTHQLRADYFENYAQHLETLPLTAIEQEGLRLPEAHSTGGYLMVVVGDRARMGSLLGFGADPEAVELAWLE
jgi:zinc protease